MSDPTYIQLVPACGVYAVFKDSDENITFRRIQAWGLRGAGAFADAGMIEPLVADSNTGTLIACRNHDDFLGFDERDSPLAATWKGK